MRLDDPVNGTYQAGTLSPQDFDPLSALRLSFDGAAHGIVVAAADGTIVFVNDLASRLFAYSPGELLGQPLSRVLPDPTPPAAEDGWIEFWRSPDRRPVLKDWPMAGL